MMRLQTDRTTRASVVFMFSGQGSHYAHMGRDLMETSDVFRGWMQRGNAFVQQHTGRSVLDAVYAEETPRGRPFDDIRVSHPAIFMTEVATAQHLLAIGIRPRILIGSSVGIFAAWAIAGCLTFEQCLEAVIDQARVVSDTCPPGGMLAVLGSPSRYRSDPVLYRTCELAGVNFERHFVVSGSRDPLGQVARHLQRERVPTHLLPVRFAFHSHHVEPAAEPFHALLRGLPERPAAIPVLDTVSSEGAGHPLWRAVREPTNFGRAIRRLAASPHDFIDVGPSGTLATFVKYILPPFSPCRIFPVLTPFGNDAANRAQLVAAVAAR